MADLNKITDFQYAMRDGMIAPVTFADSATLQAKHSSFMLGGELVLLVDNNREYVWVPSSTATADGLNVIKPNDLAATDAGRWLLLGARQLQCSATYDPGNLVDAAGVTTTVACVGAALGDTVIPSFSLNLQGILLTAYVSAADVVSFRFQNETGGAIDLASGTLRGLVLKV